MITDGIGLRLAKPDAGWRDRPDMDLAGTASFRASIVARARFIDDLVRDQVAAGVGQYVILGAGLDTFAQRHPDLTRLAADLRSGPTGHQAWKRRRLAEEGYPSTEGLRFVPVDFESANPGGMRCRPTASMSEPDGGLVDRRQHVPHQGRDRRHPASGGRHGTGIGAGDDVHAAAGPG